MIPISDRTGQRRHRFPIVMITIVAANVVVFLYQLALGSDLQRFIFSYGNLPFEITTGRDIPPTIPYPVYFTLITSMFLHGGILHIAGNMLFLWVFGDNVEDRLGHLGFLLFYLLCGILAALSQIITDPISRVPSIGASGAIAGVLAAYLVLFPHASVRTLLILGPFITMTRISAFFLIGFWFVLQFVAGITSLGAGQAGGVAYWAHVGGFVAGFVLILLFRPQRRMYR